MSHILTPDQLRDLALFNSYQAMQYQQAYGGAAAALQQAQAQVEQLTEQVRVLTPPELQQQPESEGGQPD